LPEGISPICNFAITTKSYAIPSVLGNQLMPGFHLPSIPHPNNPTFVTAHNSLGLASIAQPQFDATCLDVRQAKLHNRGVNDSQLSHSALFMSSGPAYSASILAARQAMVETPPQVPVRHDRMTAARTKIDFCHIRRSGTIRGV
jgi:hypothetical protein